MSSGSGRVALGEQSFGRVGGSLQGSVKPEGRGGGVG